MGQLFKPTFVDQHCVTVASDKGEARGHDDKDLVALSLVSHHHAAVLALGDLPVAKFVWSQSATIPSPLLFFANLAIDAMNE